MFVVIAGGGRTAMYLAGLLVNQHHRVHVIEHRREVLAHMHSELPTEVIYEGNALESHVLEQAGIREADVLAACTPDDADNLMLCFTARTRYGIARTIAWINNPRTAWLFDETFHVDAALNQAEILASLIEEEMSLGDMMVLLKLHRGQFSLVEEKIPPSAPAIGVAIKHLVLPANTVIAGIIRDGAMVIPRGDTAFEAGDEVLAITDPEGAERLAELFGPQRC
jgi:trk system potassium uptake protein TrkA